MGLANGQAVSVILRLILYENLFVVLNILIVVKSSQFIFRTFSKLKRK